jgi:hypothetical protein
MRIEGVSVGASARLHSTPMRSGSARRAKLAGSSRSKQFGESADTNPPIRIRRYEFAGERRLAAPTRTQQRNNPAAAQSGADKSKISRAGQHNPESHHENPAVNAGFPW